MLDTQVITTISELPDPRVLCEEDHIGLDTETKDPNLLAKGPGFIRNDGHLAGISIGFGGRRAYIPIGHDQGINVSKTAVAAYFTDLFRCARRCTFVGANVNYDFGWIRSDLGVIYRGPRYDVQVAEALIDENQFTYELESLGQKYVGQGKDESALESAVARLGITFASNITEKTKMRRIKSNLWRLRPEEVAEYAGQDAWLPLQIMEEQRAEIEAQQLGYVLDLENDLLPCWEDMQFRGVRVDLEKASMLYDKTGAKEREEYEFLEKMAGFELNPLSPKDLERAFGHLGLEPGRTEKGNASFNADVLAGINHPFTQGIVEYKKTQKMRKDFIQGVIMKENIDGRIHASIHPTRKDDSGTRSGRLSYSNPNLQQIPSRDKYWGPLIRSMFIPEQGGRWCKCDYSQQEPRLTVQYAEALNLKGAKDVAERYRKDPTTDYHTLTQELACQFVDISRRDSKDINLGLAYGMGKAKLAQKLGVSKSEVEEFLSAYCKAMPFLTDLADMCMNYANNRGWVKTISGRRSHFDLWEPRNWDLRKKAGYKAYPLEIAREKWPHVAIARAMTHKALNRIIQGSAADVTKEACRALYKEGIVCHIQVHDELNNTIYEMNEVQHMKEVMESCVELKVPMLVEPEVGPSWGEVKECTFLQNTA